MTTITRALTASAAVSATMLSATVLTVALTAAAAGPAHADELVADSQQQGVLVAAAPSVAHRPEAAGPVARASRPRTIVVTGHGGQPVSLFATGRAPLRQPRPGGAPATFTGLAAGTAYTVIVGGHAIGTVTAIDAPAAATRLVAHAIGAPGSVTLGWQYRAARTTGGSRVGFDVQATAAGEPTVRAHVAGGRSASLAGLATDAFYTFTVTPTNSAGRGHATTATMTRTLAQLGGATTPVPTTPVPPAPAAPAPAAPAPAAPATPAAPPTRTIYLCPTGYAENPAGTCTRTLPYTYHQVVSGPAPLLVSYETDAPACPAGYSLEDYGWVRYCRTYGPAPTTQVKDATPAGFTDTGTAWERTVPKDAVVVPA